MDSRRDRPNAVLVTVAHSLCSTSAIHTAFIASSEGPQERGREDMAGESAEGGTGVSGEGGTGERKGWSRREYRAEQERAGRAEQDSRGEGGNWD